jgi:hypothetical protein
MCGSFPLSRFWRQAVAAKVPAPHKANFSVRTQKATNLLPQISSLQNIPAFFFFFFFC